MSLLFYKCRASVSTVIPELLRRSAHVHNVVIYFWKFQEGTSRKVHGEVSKHFAHFEHSIVTELFLNTWQSVRCLEFQHSITWPKLREQIVLIQDRHKGVLTPTNNAQYNTRPTWNMVTRQWVCMPVWLQMFVWRIMQEQGQVTTRVLRWLQTHGDLLFASLRNFVHLRVVEWMRHVEDRQKCDRPIVLGLSVMSFLCIRMVVPYENQSGTKPGFWTRMV